ncbi:hypothetical protein Ancab_010356, partial [Ancistrocladus abbreviatus]
KPPHPLSLTAHAVTPHPLCSVLWLYLGLSASPTCPIPLPPRPPLLPYFSLSATYIQPTPTVSQSPLLNTTDLLQVPGQRTAISNINTRSLGQVVIVVRLAMIVLLLLTVSLPWWTKALPTLTWDRKDHNAGDIALNHALDRIKLACKVISSAGTRERHWEELLQLFPGPRRYTPPRTLVHHLSKYCSLLHYWVPQLLLLSHRCELLSNSRIQGYSRLSTVKQAITPLMEWEKTLEVEP